MEKEAAQAKASGMATIDESSSSDTPRAGGTFSTLRLGMIFSILYVQKVQMRG